MKKGISGSKKTGKEAHANMDTKMYELVLSNSSIKTVSLNYYLDLLWVNKTAKVVTDHIELIGALQDLRMKDDN